MPNSMIPVSPRASADPVTLGEFRGSDKRPARRYDPGDQRTRGERMRFLEHFDHFVVPVDDVLAAEDFYQDVFGCHIALNPHGTPMRIGLNVREWKGGMRPHTFFDVAGE